MDNDMSNSMPKDLPDGPITDQKTGKVVGNIIDGAPVFTDAALASQLAGSMGGDASVEIDSVEVVEEQRAKPELINANELRLDLHPRWTLHRGALSMGVCAYVRECAEYVGFTPGTYSSGDTRGNVQVCFLYRAKHKELTPIFELLGKYADNYAMLSGIRIHFDLMESVQISKWSEGDWYHWHPDHDCTMIDITHDRKLSLYVPLTAWQGLELAKDGKVHCNTGDMLVMNSLMSHQRPKQEKGVAYSLVAWVPGPRWS